MEHFEGIVILTTNFEAGLDDAFARRIRFRIGFQEPDEAARARLWRVLLPKQVPLATDVDLPRLAKDYVLSGGHIKEAVLRAASLALANGGRVGQHDLRRSAEAEYRKLGRLFQAGARHE